MSAGRVRARCAAIVVMACAFAQLLAVRGVFFSAGIDRGLLMQGWFEEIGGRPKIVLGDRDGRELFPGPGIDARAGILVSPGTTAVIRLDPGSSYLVTSAAPFPAYVVVGVRNVHSPTPHDATPYLDGARRLEVADGRLAMVEWDAARPWSEDRASLVRLQEACGTAADRTGADIRLSLGERGMRVQVGHCELEAGPLPEGPPIAAVIGGPNWGRISRDPEWKPVETFSFGALAQLGVIACAEAAALAAVGPTLVIAVSAAALAASYSHQVYALIALAVMVPVALCIAVWKLANRYLPFRFGIRLAIAVVAVALLPIGGAFLVRRDLWRPPPSPPNPGCLLIGYSAAAGSGMRFEGGGISKMLPECSACDGGASAWTRPGGRFRWTRDRLCSVEAELPSHGSVVFYGGVNDDLLWVHDREDYARDARAVLRFIDTMYRRALAPGDLAEFIRALSTSALNSADDQLAMIRETRDCVRARGLRFVFVHDFFIFDLAEGRPDQREELVAKRRTAVDPDGQTRVFVDLLEALGSEIGVSWFNDIRHPSLIGHRHITELICRVLAR